MGKSKQLLIATSNRGKFREIVEILEGVPYEVLSLEDIGVAADFEEKEEDLEQNALEKARYYFQKAGILTLAEDSGIFVDALAGELGVKTRRWGAGEKATDQEWIDYFLKRMESVPEGQRGARFACCAAVVGPDGAEFVACGKTEGVITHALEAPIYHGLPLSACFRPEGFDKVYSALTIAEKNAISHRGKAIRGVMGQLMKKN